MATNVTLNGTTYAIPGLSETGWGDEVSNYLIAQASGLLQKAGGAFTLTAEVDFGATYGLKSAYFKSRGTVASAGILRLANTETIAWRNNANDGDLALTSSASDRLTYDSVNVPTISSTDVFTNKSIDADNNTITNLVNASIKNGAGIALNKLAAVTADRALVSDGSGVVSASAVTATELGYVSGVTSAIQTQINTNASGISTNASDITTLDNAAAKTADNENITGTWDFDNPLTMAHNSTPANPAASHNKLYFKSDDKLYKLDSAGNEIEVGSGTGSGEINYITNPGFESNTDGYSTYDNGATATPTDGTTGTSSNLTISAQDTEVLRGAKSLKIAKAAADAQGEGVSVDFTIKGQDTSKKLKIQFDFKTDEDATYNSGDFTVYIYDVTNSTLITPVDTDIIAGQNIFQTSFNSTTSTSYRLIFHCAASHSDAFDIYIDDVIVGPGMTSQGAVVGGSESLTLNSTHLVNATGLTIASSLSSCKIARQGDRALLSFRIDFNGGGSGTDAGAFGLNIAQILNDVYGVSGWVASEFLYGPIGLFAVGGSTPSSRTPGTYSCDEGASVLNFSWESTLITGTQVSSVTAGEFRVFAGELSFSVNSWAGKGIVPMLAQDNLSEWQSFTPSWEGLVNTSSDTAFYRRVGDTMEITTQATLSGAVTTTIKLVIPGGLTVDTTSMTNNTVNGNTWGFDSSTGARYSAPVLTDSTTKLVISDVGGATGNWSATAPFTWATGDIFSLNAKIPIAEWAGSQNSLVGYSQADGTNTGLLPPVTSMSDALATQLGYKIYTGAISGADVDLSDSNTLTAVGLADFIPYQTSSGEWRMKFNIDATTTGSPVGGQFTISGVTFKGSSTAIRQPVAGVLTTSNTGTAYAVGTTGRLDWFSNVGTPNISFSGDVALTSKPTWAV